MGNKSWRTDLWELSSIFRAVLGLLPDHETLSRNIQRVWVFLVPPIVGIAFLELLDEELEAMIGSWILLAALLAIFFWNGLQGWRHGKRWLLILGFYYLAICLGGYVLEKRLLEFLPRNILNGILVVGIFVGVPSLFPMLVTGQLDGFPYTSRPFAPSCLLVWLLLALAWRLGRAAAVRRRGKVQKEKRVEPK